MNAPTDRSLRWRCRRGMLELDILLERFLDRRYAALEPEERELFHQLLDQEDDVLWDWLSGKIEPEEQGIAQLVQQIRSTR